jgi:hypothetical protein
MGLSIHRAHLRRNLAPMIPPSTTQGATTQHLRPVEQVEQPLKRQVSANGFYEDPWRLSTDSLPSSATGCSIWPYEAQNFRQIA